MPRASEQLEASDIAYHITQEGDAWIVTACRRNEDGHHPVRDYGAHTERRAMAIADDLNARLGHTQREAAIIVASTMAHGIRRGKRRNG